MPTCLYRHWAAPAGWGEGAERESDSQDEWGRQKLSDLGNRVKKLRDFTNHVFLFFPALRSVAESRAPEKTI